MVWRDKLVGLRFRDDSVESGEDRRQSIDVANPVNMQVSQVRKTAGKDTALTSSIQACQRLLESDSDGQQRRSHQEHSLHLHCG